MLAKIKQLFVAFMCICLLVPCVSYANTNSSYTTSAYSCVVMDANTNTVFYSVNANAKLSIASTTKILTSLIACESGKLYDIVTITSDMLNTEGTMLYLKEGDKISLLDLVKGALLASGNDAANAIAIYLGKTLSDFSNIMNTRAKELGMNNSLFVTPSGLDQGNHHSTAYDMAVLTCYALQNKTFSSICALRSAQITVNSTKSTIYNHNKLLSDSPNFIGVKTGYTSKAGRCLVSAYNYNSNNIVCVTLNDANDWADHKKLVLAATDEYKTFNNTDSLCLDVVGGTKSQLTCTYSYNVTALNNVNIKLFYFPFVYAPIQKGDIVGYALIYTSTNSLIKKVPITATEGINYYGKQSNTTSKIYGR